VIRLLLVAAVALALAAPATAGLPVYPAGSVVGEGVPLKAYATVSPTVHLFGDKVTARLAVVADTKWVVPARLRVHTSFEPYRQLRKPSIVRVQVGRFAQITWTWTLQCLTTPCAPRVPPSERYHDFRFQTIFIDYLSTRGTRAYGITATWPKVEVQTQVTPGVRSYMQETNRFRWLFHTTPVASPTYRISPSVLFSAALALAGALALATLVLGRRWYRVLRPPAVAAAAAADPSPTTLERALQLLAWAHASGDETLERKTLERVAAELDVEDVDELSRAARELAWSQRTPADEDVETLAERAREAAG
jgi:hypothetical protein